MACCAATSRAACRVQPSSGYLVPKILSPSWPRRGIMWPTPQRYAQTLALSYIVLAQRRINSGGERGSVVVRPLQTGPPLTAMGSFRRSVELADAAIVGLPPLVVRPVLLSSCIFHRQATGRLPVRPSGFLMGRRTALGRHSYFAFGEARTTRKSVSICRPLNTASFVEKTSCIQALNRCTTGAAECSGRVTRKRP